MTPIKVGLIALGLVFSTQAAHAVIADNSQWQLSNKDSFGIRQFGETDYDLDKKGASVVAKYANNKLTITGKAYNRKNKNLVNVSLTYDDLRVTNNQILASDTDRLGKISNVRLDGKKNRTGYSLVLTQQNASSVTASSWFQYANGNRKGEHYGDLHVSGNLSSPPTTSVSEPAMGLAFLGAFGLVAYSTRRKSRKS